MSFLTPLFFIFLAELGDKSMLLAVAFSAKYPARTVLWGVLCATALNHLLVVVAGSLIASALPMSAIEAACAASFVVFGLWTLRGDTLGEGDLKERAKAPFFAVAVAFFLSEMGDKTQLATLSLATEHNAPLLVWLGSTIGMVMADAVGIAAGRILGGRVPEGTLKLLSGGIFIAVGFWGLYAFAPEGPARLPLMACLALAVFLGGWAAGRARR